MYIPPHVAVNDPQILHRITRGHPLGALMTPHAPGLDADRVPFDFDPGAFISSNWRQTG